MFTTYDTLGQRNVGIGTAIPNEQLEITGNLRLTPRTSTTGIIKSGSNTFIHTYGANNFFAGINAGNLTTTGSANTASGYGALDSNTTGGFNAAIGGYAGILTGDLTNATAIGYGANVNASNKVRIGDNNVTLVETAGNLRVGAGGTAGCVQDGDGTVLAGICASDARLKTDIRPFDALLDRLVQLKPVYFRWKQEEYPELQLGSAESFGLIAQEVEKVLPELVTEDSRNGHKAFKYNMLPLMLLKAVKEQQEIIDAQQARIEELEKQQAQIEEQQEQIDELRKIVEELRK